MKSTDSYGGGGIFQCKLCEQGWIQPGVSNLPRTTLLYTPAFLQYQSFAVFRKAQPCMNAITATFKTLSTFYRFAFSNLWKPGLSLWHSKTMIFLFLYPESMGWIWNFGHISSIFSDFSFLPFIHIEQVICTKLVS
jgi:hypothetical protein